MTTKCHRRDRVVPMLSGGVYCECPHCCDLNAHRCSECGEPFFIDEHGVAHHSDEAEPSGIDYEADAHHTPHLEDTDAED